MNLPPGMDREDVINRIQVVIDRISPKYTFNGYEVDDIKQEAFIICANALERYNPEVGPLENFLSINLSNRLKNFIRDNFCKKEDVEKKKVIAPSTLSFDYIDQSEPCDEKVSSEEIKEIIDTNIPINMRIDYLKILGGITIPKKRKLEVMEKIRKILEEHGINEAR